MTPGLRILLEDEHCLAVFKPAGQLTQGTWAPPGETTLEQDVRRHLNPGAPETAYVGIVHRLDRPVSGVLLWAKTPKAARRLAGQFEKRQVGGQREATGSRNGCLTILRDQRVREMKLLKRQPDRTREGA